MLVSQFGDDRFKNRMMYTLYKTASKKDWKEMSEVKSECPGVVGLWTVFSKPAFVEFFGALYISNHERALLL